jgi:hypothetical protein
MIKLINVIIISSAFIIASCRAESDEGSSETAYYQNKGMDDASYNIGQSLRSGKNGYAGGETVSCSKTELGVTAKAHSTHVPGVRKLCMDYMNREVRQLNGNEEVELIASNCTLTSSPNETYFAIKHMSFGVCFVLTRDLYR